MDTVWKVLTRKKIINSASAEETGLSRVLTVYDLTALGVGSTLGVGVYVLAGQVAKSTAGPAVVLSFLIAAIASIFAGLCYAEFGARVPRAGSAYIYSYVCVGEFIAFVIGWNLILEYVIGSASVARCLSLYLDTLLNDTMKDAFIDVAPINISFMSSYFDFFAFTITFLLTIALAFGMKESSFVNNILTILNICVVLFVIIAGSIKADVKNWEVEANTTHSNDTNIGEGGFFPFGIEGMIKGAATCFYGFVGFDCIATTGEEAKNPKRAIPISIIASLFIIFLAYFGTSVVVTLMVPYYLQDAHAPIPHAFEAIGWDFAKWIVAIGGIFGLCASLFGAMFPLPRVIYAMASDSLVFHFLGQVSERFRTPVVGTLIAGLLTGLMAALFELEQLVKMMSIGTLLAYTIVSASVLLLRYSVEEKIFYEILPTTSDSDENDGYTENRSINNSADTIDDDDLANEPNSSVKKILGQVFNIERHKNPTKLSQNVVASDIFLYCIMCILIGICAKYLKNPLSNGEEWAISLTSITVCLAVLLIISVATQPTSQTPLNFKVPFIPVIPALSILINIYLMLMLDSHTWIRFGVWMIIGLPLYYLSVNLQPQASNTSLKSNLSNNTIVLNNIHDNKTYVNTENDELDSPEIVLKQFDDLLEKEDLKIELNTMNNNCLDVVADVHCADECSVSNLYVNDVQKSSPVDNLYETVEYTDVAIPKPPPMPPIYENTSTDDDNLSHTYEPVIDSTQFQVINGIRPTKSQLESVVLRKTDNSVEKENDVVELEPPPDGNVDFNSLQYKQFREKLEDTIVRVSTPPQTHFKTVVKPVAIDRDALDSIKSNVDSENIDRNNVKRVINDFLTKNNVNESSNGKIINYDSQLMTDDEKKIHHNKMQNVFDSIKLRNNDL